VEDASNHSPLHAAGKNSADGGHGTNALSQPSDFVTAEGQGNEGEAEAPQQFDYIDVPLCHAALDTKASVGFFEDD
jgi:hypothetical protein